MVSHLEPGGFINGEEDNLKLPMSPAKEEKIGLQNLANGPLFLLHARGLVAMLRLVAHLGRRARLASSLTFPSVNIAHPYARKGAHADGVP
jgi:hypothetical protein